MPRLNGIQNVLGRIQTIKARFKPPSPQTTMPTKGMPFDMQLKQAMGKQNAGALGQMGGPDSLMALVNRMGTSQYGVGTGTLNERIAQLGKEWDGKEFKPGQTKRCADFVSTVIEKSGAAPPGFKHEINCLRLQKYGRKIERNDLKPGDIVYFGNTYMAGDYTHVGVYLGNNKFVHRPTSAKPVRVDELSGYYGNKFCGARRLHG